MIKHEEAMVQRFREQIETLERAGRIASEFDATFRQLEQTLATKMPPLPRWYRHPIRRFRIWFYTHH